MLNQSKYKIIVTSVNYKLYEAEDLNRNITNTSTNKMVGKIGRLIFKQWGVTPNVIYY